MSAGVIPVVFNAGGQKEIVNKGCGYLWSTKEELGSITMELIKNQKLLIELSKNAIKRSKLFTGNRFCEELARIVNEK